MIDMQDINLQPSLDEVSEFIRNPLFDTFCTELEKQFRAKYKIEFSKCCWEPGWNVKFRKSGKSLCTIYPRENYFTVLVVVGNKEKKEVEQILPEISGEMRSIYHQTKEGNGQRWLMIDLEDEELLYEDVLKFISIRAGNK